MLKKKINKKIKNYTPPGGQEQNHKKKIQLQKQKQFSVQCQNYLPTKGLKNE